MKPWIIRAIVLKSTTNLTLEEIAVDKQVQKHYTTVLRALETDEAKSYMIELKEKERTEMHKNAQICIDQRLRLRQLAMDTCESLMNDDDVPPSVKAKVAIDVLKGVGEFTDRQEITGKDGAPLQPPNFTVVFDDEDKVPSKT